jgi:hypothetical protein
VIGFLHLRRAWLAAGLAILPFLPGVLHAEDSAVPAPTVRVRWKKPKDHLPVAEVTGLDAEQLRRLDVPGRPAAEWQRILSVHSGKRGEPRRDLPQVAGSYFVTNGVLRFRMAFPLQYGIEYLAEFHPSAVVPGSTNPLVSDRLLVLPLSSSERPSTVVSAVYPSASVLPENLLKFYLQFSGPMSRGDVYRHIRLLDEAGKAVELPFLELDEELWNPEMTRLTLLLDPGRIKRGVRPLEEVGPALEVGKSYRLTLSAEWRDAAGRPLKAPFTRRFQVGPADRETPDPARWTLTPPTAGARTPLSLAFPDPMDQALLSRLLGVTEASGATVPGTTTLGDSERRWTFVPDRPWKPGAYRIPIPATLEDLAGNNIGKPFDVDLSETPSPRSNPSPATLAFEVK